MDETITMKRAYILNVITAVLVLFAVLWMFSGIQFGYIDPDLQSFRFRIFRYYTVDSNVLMGLAAAILAREEKKVLTGQKAAVEPFYYGLKLAGVTGVTLTMLVTVCFLAPGFENGWLICFNNSAILLHLIIPLLSIFTFLVFERTPVIPWKYTLFAILSVVIYGSCYMINCIVHASGNTVPAAADWYHFCDGGLKAGLLAFPVILLVSYGISVLLWRMGK